jgi:hypothetical protein
VGVRQNLAHAARLASVAIKERKNVWRFSTFFGESDDGEEEEECVGQ